MKPFFNRLFRESMVGPVGAITLAMLAGLLYLIPYLVKEQSKKDAFLEAERLTSYVKTFRAYYSNNVLNKIDEKSNLKINFNHKTQNDVIPLAATMVHDLGALFSKRTVTSVAMYSNYPFPNRKERVLDDFQKEALVFALKNPQKAFSKEETINDVTYYRTAFPDSLTSKSCVECHNSRTDSPKTSWKLGDLRGVMEVSVPMETSIGSAKKLTFSILAFILLNFGLLGVYYFFHMKRKNRTLQERVTNKDKLLSEYKKAVDLGAIVSKADKNGIITYVNDEFTQISGYSREELIGQEHSLVRHPDSPKEIFDEMWKKLLNKEVWQGDLKNLTKDGRDYYVYATIVPILDERDEIVEFLAIRYDTTNLREAIKNANEAEKTKGRFLANMSHELRTPLNAIIGFSQIMQRKGTLSDKDALYIEKIGLSGQNLLTLVNSILDFSKIEEGEMECNPSEVNVKALFEEILVMFETALAEKNVRLSMFECDENESLFADKQLLKQAFINIISNAVKFTQKNGEIKITYEKKDSKSVFGICDNGEGISKEDAKTLFEPFKQGQSAKESSAKGTGLGLAITKRIIQELHSGEIWVQSELGEGSCFYVSL